ncbi:unnamed protein product [Mytilus coruscus]|uniref:Uncharacterized protein n=1 Tax=Mytilus coruscus TaxID=42192 RepID=A0A6J8EIZ1_MYTCO|nr:unnamed protein product [Mytilus coruscus]
MNMTIILNVLQLFKIRHKNRLVTGEIGTNPSSSEQIEKTDSLMDNWRVFIFKFSGHSFTHMQYFVRLCIDLDRKSQPSTLDSNTEVERHKTVHNETPPKFKHSTSLSYTLCNYNKRHKGNENDEHFDTSNNSSKQNSDGDTRLSKQTSQIESYNNQAFEKDENRKVATVSPTIRSSDGSQNNEQTNQNRHSQSKEGYENVIAKDQTDISEGETSHRTALVNSVNPSAIQRQVADIKKKWQDIQSLAKKKEAARLQAVRRTGGGPPPEDTLKSWEKNIIGTFTKTMVEGIEGGFDTSDTSDGISCGSGAVGGQPNAIGYKTNSCMVLDQAKEMHLEIKKFLEQYRSNSKSLPKIGENILRVNEYKDFTKGITEELRDELTNYISTFKEVHLSVPDIPSMVHDTIVFILQNLNNTAQQDNMIQSVDEIPDDRTPTDDFNEAAMSKQDAASEAEERYFLLEESKLQKIEMYRAKKLKIMEQMLEMQRRSTVALEAIRASQRTEHQFGIDLHCLSPVIKFSESYFVFFWYFEKLITT